MSKSNLILLHGALGTKAQLEPLKNILTDHFNVFTLNFEGHGDKLSDKEFSIDLFAENLLDFLNENGLEKTHIFGYSMGGYVAIQLALTSSERLDKIITLGTKFNWTKEVADQEIKMLNPAKIEEKVPAFAQRLNELHSANDWKGVMARTARMMSGLGSGDALKKEDLSSIKQDILIGIGALDNMVTIEESRGAADILSNGQLKVIEGFKHPIEKVDKVHLAKIIQTFLKG